MLNDTVYWKPASANKEPIKHDGKLFKILEKRYDFPSTFDDCDMPYFEGLDDAGIKGASAIVEYIREHGSIELYK